MLDFCPQLKCSQYQHRNEKYLLSFSLNMFNLAHFLYKVFFSLRKWFLYSFSFSSVAQSCPTLFDPMNHSMAGLLVHHQTRGPRKPISIESVMPSSHLILCHLLLLVPSIFHSIWVFSNESAIHMRCPKYCSFNFNITPTNEHPGLISFRMD